jgi:hypothetical protein
MKEAKTKGLSRRSLTLIISLAVGAIIVWLLYIERIDVLYILATLSLVVLLAIVATSNLGEFEAKPPENPENPVS